MILTHHLEAEEKMNNLTEVPIRKNMKSLSASER
jgi:hypothetical protein